MKLSVNANTLLDGTSRASKATPHRPTLAEHGYVKLVTSQDQVAISGTDGFFFLTVSVPCEVEDHGIAMVRPSDLMKAIEYEHGTIAMETSGGRVVVCGTKLPTTDPEMFPVPESGDVLGQICLSTEERRALGVTCSPASVLPKDNSIHVISKDDYTQYMTNIAGAWMTYFRHTEEDAISSLIPYRYLSDAMSALVTADGALVKGKTVLESELGSAVFSNANAEPIGVDFDRFEHILSCWADPDDLLAVLDQGEYFSDDDNQIDMSFRKDGINIRSRRGIDFEREIDAKVEGDELDLIANARILKACVQSLGAHLEIREYNKIKAIWVMNSGINHVVIEMKPK